MAHNNCCESIFDIYTLPGVLIILFPREGEGKEEPEVSRKPGTSLQHCANSYVNWQCYGAGKMDPLYQVNMAPLAPCESSLVNGQCFGTDQPEYLYI